MATPPTCRRPGRAGTRGAAIGFAMVFALAAGAGSIRAEMPDAPLHPAQLAQSDQCTACIESHRCSQSQNFCTSNCMAVADPLRPPCLQNCDATYAQCFRRAQNACAAVCTLRR